MFTLVLALALAAPNPSMIDAPRNAFRACLKTFETNQMKAKVDAAVYANSVKSACSSEAQASAQRDVNDYRLTSEERYRDLASPQ